MSQETSEIREELEDRKKDLALQIRIMRETTAKIKKLETALYTIEQEAIQMKLPLE